MNIRPVASKRKPRPKPEIGRPSASMSAPPRAMLIMPSVAMNGGSRPKVTRRPLARPHTRPTISPMPIPTGTGSPAASERPSAMPASASTDPTDRSMPPETMTNVMPTATIALIAVCSSTFRRFDTVRKCGVAAHSIRHRTTRPPNVPSCRAACMSPSRRIALEAASLTTPHRGPRAARPRRSPRRRRDRPGRRRHASRECGRSCRAPPEGPTKS
jgi:hypothetical protein